MVSPVDPVLVAARLAALLRQGSEPAPSRAAKTPAGAAPSVPAGGAPTLAQALQARLSRIDGRHPDRQRARVRTLVEGLLLSEFDPAAPGAPAFGRLVDEVADALQQTPGLQRDLNRLLTLLDPASPP